ncbi:MAG: site-2 protease family protein [Actinobacteria bacterium]|nr:site-2 protease family protein [Actinomycetota bacterium]
MRLSARLFRVFGIEVRIHATFIFIVAYFAYLWGVVEEPGGAWGALYGVLLVVLLFVLVVIHELTHSRVAQHYGINVRDITLLPIGGISSMEEIPQEPRKELAISIAGPLSNVVLTLIMLAFLPLVIDWNSLSFSDFFGTVILERSFVGAYSYLMVTNAFLALFNLLPAFPLDGGRVFRALLALRMDRARATRVAVRVGQAVAVAMAVYGFLGGGIFLILVALFIFLGAQGEGGQDEGERHLSNLRVSQVVNPRVHVARRGQTLGDVAARLFHTYQEDFPVLSGHGELEGILTRDRLIAELGRHGSAYPVAEAMRTDFPTVGLDDTVQHALRKMREGRFKAIPIVDKGVLVGMLSLEDIAEVVSLLSAGGKDLLGRVSVVKAPERK